MLELTIFNLVLLIIISVILIILKKFVKSERAQNTALLVMAILTIHCHYSSLLYHHLTDDTAFEYLRANPNLILPIYPCNVVMWSCLIYGFMKNKSLKICLFLSDYIFWFGIFSTLIGMFANVDFIRNPTLLDYDITKGIVAHATLLNVLMLPIFGRIKINFGRNMKNIFLSVLMMFVIGLYCNLIYEVLTTKEMAYEVNSMFIIHSPFEGVDFLTYPVIASIALVLYFVVFLICELIAHKKGDRWFDTVVAKLKKKN